MTGRRPVPGTFILVCGLPGVGKTRHATRVAGVLPAIRLSADDWMDHLGIDLWDQGVRDRVESLQWELALELLSAGQNVVIEWGTWSRGERDALRDAAQQLGATTELHYLHAPLEVLKRRIEQRDREDPPIAGQHLMAWAQDFEPPDDEECRRWDRFFTVGP